MRSESLTKIINAFNSVGTEEIHESLMIRRVEGDSLLVTTHTNTTICQIVIPNEKFQDCMIHKDKVVHLKALLKEHKKSEIPDNELARFISPVIANVMAIDESFSDAYNSRGVSFTARLPDIESIIKSIKEKSGNIKFTLCDNNIVMLSNESGDMGISSLIIS